MSGDRNKSEITRWALYLVFVALVNISENKTNGGFIAKVYTPGRFTFM